MKQLHPAELAQWRADADRPAPLVLDVREPWEVAIAQLPDSVTMPMNEIPARIDELPRDRAIVCLCHHGMRSMQVAHFLDHHGYPEVYNLSGGIDAWARVVDPSCATY
ncbi:MAG TPA: rhodanese-like domain-containing protein [Quisquiliibacterium sp.]|nr:rhodanese-like domain-containing protein [Quisquiliibacterium sp.]